MQQSTTAAAGVQSANYQNLSERRDKRLRSHVRLLGNLLGQVIREQNGDALFQTIEILRKGFIKLRKKDNPRRHQVLIRRVAKLSDQQIDDVIRAFSIYFALVNVAEEMHSNYTWRHNRRLGLLNEGSFRQQIKRLQDEGASAQAVQNLLNQLLFEPVFTAHPTEAKRRTVLQLAQKIFLTLGKLEYTRYRDEKNAIYDHLKTLICILWKTDEVRLNKPSVETEVLYGLYYFNTSLFVAVPAVYSALEKALQEIYPEYTFQVPSFIRFGSWIGGDRDGNPFVIPEVTRRTVKLQSIVILEEYARRLDHLINTLTHSDNFIERPESLTVISEHNRSRTHEIANGSSGLYLKEPYRRMLTIMKHKIDQRCEYLHKSLKRKNVALSGRAYKSEHDFLDDLRLIDTSLRQHGDAAIANQALKDLIRLAETFGFHLTRLDVRDEATQHDRTVGEILKQWGYAENYHELAAEKRTALLNECLDRQSLPRINAAALSRNAQKVMDVLRCIREAKSEIGEKSIGNYVISMTRHISDMLEVMLLARIVGLAGTDSSGKTFCKIHITPLFETIEDLQRIGKTLRSLYTNPTYLRLLQAAGNLQEVMLGYSDSCKDGGIIASAWNLYAAQKHITSISAEYGVACRIFHGRGGTIGRGGGPIHKAIIAQPPNTVNGQIRITEQGEVLSFKYSNPETAIRELTLTLSGIMQASRHLISTVAHEPAEYCAFAQKIADFGEHFYRALVDETAGLFDYFYEATPVREIAEMNIGSRPSHRKMTDRSKLSIRAIPWVFGWSLSRHTLPAWYGIGYALATYHNQDAERLREMQQIYREWPFFNTLINNTQIALLKANMSIAYQYSRLCASTTTADCVFGKIHAEYRRTLKYVLMISQFDRPLEDQKALMLSIQRRDPYLDSLNHIQVSLLHKHARNTAADLRNERARTRSRLPLMRSISAIAAGMRNTG